jgi:hypothetical protein
MCRELSLMAEKSVSSFDDRVNPLFNTDAFAPILPPLKLIVKSKL